MNTFVRAKPTRKRRRMAVILQSKYTTPCAYCGNESVRVGTFEYEDKRLFSVEHLCVRHQRFGLWGGGWEFE